MPVVFGMITDVVLGTEKKARYDFRKGKSC